MQTSGGREDRRSRRFASLTALLGVLSAFAVSLAMPGDSQALTPPPADKAEIFFVNGGRIVSIKSDGTDRKVLTRRNASIRAFSRVSDSGPLPSPDGQTVLFTRYADDAPRKSGIFAIDRNGGVPTRVFGPRSDQVETYFSSAVDWKADGSRFYAFRFGIVQKNQSITLKSELFSLKPDGSGIRKLYATSAILDLEKPGMRDLWFPYDASVSPDGKTAVLVMSGTTSTSKERLAKVDLATGKRTWLSKNAGRADLSPDGKTVVFSSERDRKNKSCSDGYCYFQKKLYLINLNGSNLRPLLPVNREGNYQSPDFSPDGSRIVFEAGSGADRSWYEPEIWSVKTDGSCLTRLTNGSPSSSEPVWGAGSETGPATCGKTDLRPLVEVNYPKRAEKIQPRPMWLGQEYDNLLLSDVRVPHRTLFSRYADCGVINSKDCPGNVSVRSTFVCAAGIGLELGGGTYSGMERVRGGLIVNFDRGSRGIGNSTHLLTGGIDVGVLGDWLPGAKAVPRNWRRAAIDNLRYVGADAPPARFREPVFAARTIRRARTLHRNYRKLGTLKKAALATGLYGPTGKGRWQVTISYDRNEAAAWLRFARDLRKIGSFKTTECRG